MAAATLDIVISQGADYRLRVTSTTRADGTPWNLTTPGTTIRGKIRDTFDAGASLVDFTATVTDAATGAFDLTLTNVQTAGLAVSGSLESRERTGALGVYDVELVEGSEVTRILEGDVRLSREATK